VCMRVRPIHRSACTRWHRQQKHGQCGTSAAPYARTRQDKTRQSKQHAEVQFLKLIRTTEEQLGSRSAVGLGSRSAAGL
jgi:hypothetical protein